MNLRVLVLHSILFYSMSLWAVLPNDQFGIIATLPVPYPEHWVLIHDVAFDHMLEGKILVVDPEKDGVRQQVKGMFNSSFIGMFAQAGSRPEMYVIETFYSRGNRGERSDVITIYDKATLSPIGEVVLPTGKRASILPSNYTVHLINDEKFLLVYSFTPTASILVVDIVNRKILNEISLPACALIYPTGKNGFSSLCSNASMMSYQLDDKGKVISQSRIDPFFNIDEDALFERPAIIDGVGYFPTFKGNLQEIDLRGDKAGIGGRWSLITDAERKENWRPGGTQFIASDALGRMYVLMHKDGYEGSHKDPGSEIWVYDVKNKKRVQKIQLHKPALLIGITNDKSPLLFTTNVEMDIEVYNAKKGKYLRTLSEIQMETPLIIYGTR